MPVGKNALKRVSNNGYSKVNTSAPDMEHSVVADPVAEPAVAVKPEEKAAPKKVATAKAEPKKNTAPKEKKPTVKKAEPAPEADSHPDGFVCYGLGESLPVHLL